jgi:hypothetical protein
MCYNPKNQTIYNALLDKSATFSARESYKANAYKTAAEAIRLHTRCIYEEDDIYGKIITYDIPNIGLHVTTFITMFINVKTFKQQYELVYNDNIIDYSIQNIYRMLGTSCEFLIETPPQSQQLINKKLNQESSQSNTYIYI